MLAASKQHFLSWTSTSKKLKTSQHGGKSYHSRCPDGEHESRMFPSVRIASLLEVVEAKPLFSES